MVAMGESARRYRIRLDDLRSLGVLRPRQARRATGNHRGTTALDPCAGIMTRNSVTSLFRVSLWVSVGFKSRRIPIACNVDVIFVTVSHINGRTLRGRSCQLKEGRRGKYCARR